MKQIRLRTETKSRTHAEMSIGSEVGQPTTIDDPTEYSRMILLMLARVKWAVGIFNSNFAISNH